MIEAGLITPAEIMRRLEYNEARTPHDGARLVARAWLDPEFKKLALHDGAEAARLLGIEITDADSDGAEEHARNPQSHRLHAVFVLSAMAARRAAGLVRQQGLSFPRGEGAAPGLAEFGLSFPEEMEIRVHDSNADLRYCDADAAERHRGHGRERTGGPDPAGRAGWRGAAGDAIRHRAAIAGFIPAAPAPELFFCRAPAVARAVRSPLPVTLARRDEAIRGNGSLSVKP